MPSDFHNSATRELEESLGPQRMGLLAGILSCLSAIAGNGYMAYFLFSALGHLPRGTVVTEFHMAPLILAIMFLTVVFATLFGAMGVIHSPRTLAPVLLGVVGIVCGWGICLTHGAIWRPLVWLRGLIEHAY